MRATVLAIVCALSLAAFTVGCESDNNNQPSGYAAGRAGGNGEFGEGTATPGEHSDQHFRNSVDNSNNAAVMPTTQPSR